MNQLNFLRNKKLIAVVAIFLVVILLGGVYLFTKSQTAPVSEDGGITEESGLPKLSPEDIGMEVTVRPDGKALMFELTKASDIERVEYTIEYEKEIDGERVPEGIFGEMNIGQDGRTDTDYREFGTCSSGVCRYDEVVSDVTIVLKVTKKDGKDYEVRKVVKL